MLDVISKGAAQSWQMENRGKTMIADKFDFGFAVDWMRKDLAICLAEARSNGAMLPVTALVDQFYAQVQARGGGRWDTSSLIRLPASANDVQFELEAIERHDTRCIGRHCVLGAALRTARWPMPRTRPRSRCKSAWMRPRLRAPKPARAYVDIVSDAHARPGRRFDARREEGRRSCS